MSETLISELLSDPFFAQLPPRSTGREHYGEHYAVTLRELGHTMGLSDDDVLATAMDLGKRLGKVAVVSGVCDGFIGNRMLQKYLQQALFLLDEGAMPAQVDGAMEAFGMAMGPFAVGDLAGLDIGWAVRKRRREEGSAIRYSRIADLVCERGRLGQKTGRGWYRIGLAVLAIALVLTGGIAAIVLIRLTAPDVPASELNFSQIVTELAGRAAARLREFGLLP